MKEKTILLTGASGVLGSALLRHLDDHPVITLSHRRPLPGMRSLLGDITRPWLGLAPGDYHDLAADVDVVVHCAAAVNFAASPEFLHDVNVRGVGHVLRFVSDSGARLVHVSTAFIKRLHDSPENSDQEPTLNAYARSKNSGETMVEESGLPASIARLSTVIGDSSSGRIARLQAFPYLLGAAMYGLIPFIPCEPGTLADLIPQDTAAAALAALARIDGTQDKYWITAGPAALPLQRIIDIGFEAAAEHRRRDPAATKVYLEAFKSRLLPPETYGRVMGMVLSAAVENTESASLTDLRGLAATYNGAEHFPTSLGQIPGGPMALTERDCERAVRSTCDYLNTLPRQTWAAGWATVAKGR
jgi:nucleoside-diphosphate-sugar epimerase